MRATEFIKDSIERLKKDDFLGGKSYLHEPEVKKLLPLPGGSGLVYNIRGSKYFPVISIWDPSPAQASNPPKQERWESNFMYSARLTKWKKQQKQYKELGKNPPQLIGKLSLDAVSNFPLKGALRVGTITVDEDYRGLNIGKSLYGIALSILKKPMLAGSSQTPGGRMNWISLSRIPGVEVYGWLRVDDSLLNPNAYTTKTGSNKANKNIDTIMGELGASYIGKDPNKRHYFSFDVQPNKTEKELEAVVKTYLSKVYGKDSLYDIETGLYAIWTGQ
jgi:hypothetical protein